MVLGDFSSDDFGSIARPYMWILFVLCTVFNMIIMLNLLIAIISVSFEKISEYSEYSTYYEKASIIAENSYLLPEELQIELSQPNK